jgi:peroxiredoxin Q/BCP
MLEVGTIAPEFSLADQAGNTHTLKQYRGKRVVLYFYPKDDTPGCTAQACSFRDNLPRIEGIDAVVLGVSADDVKSHAKFVTKHKLNFTLLADEPKSGTPRMIDAYQSWVQKSMYGKTYMGVQRATFIIDSKGKIAHVIPKVSPKTHDDQVLAALAELA